MARHRPPTRSSHRALLIVLAFATLAAACSGDDGDEPTSESEPSPTTTTSPTGDSAPDSTPTEPVELTQGPLLISLSTGEAVDPIADAAPVVAGDALAEADIRAVTDRLPPWDGDGEPQDFNRPAASLRPPLTGQTITETFPATGDLDAPTVDPGPVEVVRFSPDGDVPIAPNVSITFNQPMVPLGTVGQLAAHDVPVTMTPEPAGSWEWIGTRTLRFQPADDRFDRLPMATDYTVEIPAGIESAAGEVLVDAVRFEFSTPPAGVRSVSPGGDQLALQPVFVAVFDQLVDPSVVLPVIELQAAGQVREIRLATDDEVEADERAADAVSRSPGRTVAFRTVHPVGANEAIDITIGPRVPSVEGPILSDTADSHRARTYPPFRVEDSTCREPCEPGDWLWVQMTNEIAAEQLDLSGFTITPEVPLATHVRGTIVEISAVTEGNTTYEFTLPADLTDIYGQALGRDQTVQFRFGPTDPLLAARWGDYTIADPYAEEPTLPVLVSRHEQLRVIAYEVEPSQYRDYRAWREDYLWDDGRLPSWPIALDITIDTGVVGDVFTDVAIHLASALDGDHGQLVVVVLPVGRYASLPRDHDDYWRNRPVTTWLSVTGLGLDVYEDGTDLYAWVTDLASGEPRSGVQVTTTSGRTTTTDGVGLAHFPLTATPTGALIATTDDGDVAFAHYEAWFTRRVPDDPVLWTVFDDRGVYKPGETAHVKGWVRVLELSDDAGLGLLPEGHEIIYRVLDPVGNEIDAGSLPVGALGGFDLDIDIPEGANLGRGWIEFETTIDDHTSHQSRTLTIQEFRRPEFEVTARAESPGPYIVNEPATVAVEAAYFSGGGLPNAEVEWLVTTSTANYQPPDWGDFTFGTWTPWWYGPVLYGAFDYDHFDYRFVEDEYYFPAQSTVREVFNGLTDGSGTHYLQMDFTGDGEGQPTTVTAQGTVFDVNRQAWAASTSVLVHPADVYVGVRSRSTFVRAGEPLDIEAIVTDIDGKPVAGRPVTIEATRLEWGWVDGSWGEQPTAVEACEIESMETPVECSFATEFGGEYRITATVSDATRRRNISELTRWVSGSNPVPSRRIELEEVTLVPDTEHYAPGDTAEILVSAPFSPASGLATVSRNGIVETIAFDAPDGSAILEFEIEDEHIPNLHLQVDLVGSATRVGDDGEPVEGVPPRPAYATGRLQLSVPPVTQTLTVSAEPGRVAVEPGDSVDLTVTVEDANGRPVPGSEVAIVVVDEAVLALSGYDLLDPLAVFYRPIRSEVSTDRARRFVSLADPEAFEATSPAGSSLPGASYAGDSGDDVAALDFEFADADASGAQSGPLLTRTAGGGRDDQAPIDVRTDFDALAFYRPDAVTDSDGEISVTVDLPDNLTRYRVMAVAVNGADRFGSDESTLTARLPIQVRPSAPRFLNFGDQFELPIVVQNQTDTELEIDVVVETANLALTHGAGRRVVVPANDRVEVRFPAAALEAGTARFRATAASADHADAATVELPVYTPATAEAFATYGVVDDGAVIQPVSAPTDVFPQFGGLEINTSSTALQALTDAVLYVSQYRFDSSDSLASRLLSVASLRDVLDAFDAEGLPEPAVLSAAVADDLAALEAMQHFDGGWPYWRRTERSIPFNTVHVVHALVEAKAAGYDVDQWRLDNALGYLRDIESRYPDSYSQQVRDSISAYALRVRMLAGDRDAAKAESLYRRAGDTLGLDAVAWLWPVIDDAAIEREILRLFTNRATETAGAATFTTDYGDGAHLLLHSDRRTDGIILEALVHEAPSSDLIPKVVAGLLGNRVRGRWSNISENSFILLAMNSYFDTFEAVDPDFVARAWLGGTYTAEHGYEGRSTDRHETLVPMDVLVEAGDADLVVAKDGDGRLYYRLGLRYAPDDLDLDPLDRGFEVTRRYESVDHPDDVWADDEGVWHVKAGAEVRVVLTMVTDSRRTHVALIDPLPAGLEPLNPDLGVTGEIHQPDLAGETAGADEAGVLADRSWWWPWQW